MYGVLPAHLCFLATALALLQSGRIAGCLSIVQAKAKAEITQAQIDAVEIGWNASEKGGHKRR